LRLGWSDLASLIDARYHYIEAPRPELYDLVADPAEKHNLAAGRPPAFRAMRAELERMPRPFERPGASDPEHARKLASLGYVTATSPASDRSDLPDPKDRIGGLAETTRFERLLAEGRDAELIEGCRRFLANNPAALDTSRMLAHLLARRGETQAAIAALEKGLSASAATAAPALRRLALERLSVLLVRAGRDSEALEIGGFDSFTDPEALNAVGVALARAGRGADARKAFERALKLDPSDSRTHSNLGQLLLAQGNVAAARARLEEAVRLDARSAEDWSRLASARAQMGDERGAFEAWRRALEADPRRYDALFNLGIAAGRQGDLATARSCLERFLAEAPRAAFPREYAEARRILRTLAGRG
jgi:Flp pilus assembly protein TadD